MYGFIECMICIDNEKVFFKTCVFDDSATVYNCATECVLCYLYCYTPC